MFKDLGGAISKNILLILLAVFFGIKTCSYFLLIVAEDSAFSISKTFDDSKTGEEENKSSSEKKTKLSHFLFCRNYLPLCEIEKEYSIKYRSFVYFLQAAHFKKVPVPPPDSGGA